MSLLQTLLKAKSESENGAIRCCAEDFAKEATLEEVREVIDYAPTIATDGSCSKGEAIAFLMAEGGKQYPELRWEASMGLTALVKHISIDVRRAIIDAGAELGGPQAKDLVVQMKDCDPHDGLRESARLVLLIWDED